MKEWLDSKVHAHQSDGLTKHRETLKGPCMGLLSSAERNSFYPHLPGLRSCWPLRRRAVSSGYSGRSLLSSPQDAKGAGRVLMWFFLKGSPPSPSQTTALRFRTVVPTILGLRCSLNLEFLKARLKDGEFQNSTHRNSTHRKPIIMTTKGNKVKWQHVHADHQSHGLYRVVGRVPLVPCHVTVGQGCAQSCSRSRHCRCPCPRCEEAARSQLVRVEPLWPLRAAPGRRIRQRLPGP